MNGLGTPLATLKLDENELTPFTLMSTVNSLGDLDRNNYLWLIDGQPCDRIPLALDQAGQPRTWQVISKVKPKRTGEFELSVVEDRPSEPRFSAKPLNAMLKLMSKGKVYTCVFGSAIEAASGINYSRRKYFARFRFREENLMGVHCYVTEHTYGTEYVFRISNAVLEENLSFNGSVYYDQIELVLNGQVHALVQPLPPGQEHLLCPNHSFHRRFQVGKPLMYARALGTMGLQFHGFGAEDAGLPEMTDDYIAGTKKGREAILSEKAWELQRYRNALLSGAADPAIVLYAHRFGPFHPLHYGDSGAGVPGGWGIGPVEGLSNSQTEIELLKLKHRCTMDRMPSKVYLNDGSSPSGYDFADKNNGVQPFYHDVIGGWQNPYDSGSPSWQQNVPFYFHASNTGKAYNTGNCPYIGKKYGMQVNGVQDESFIKNYEYYDDEHYSRGSRFAKALYYLSGDWLSRDDLIEMAQFAHYSYGEIPHGGGEWWVAHSHSLWQSKIRAESKPAHQGWFISRNWGWPIDTIAQAYVIAPKKMRDRFINWFRVLKDFLLHVQMPNGLVLRASGAPGSPLYDQAHAEGMPDGQDITGGIYIGITTQGFFAAGNATGITELMDLAEDSINAMFKYSGIIDGPAHYISPAPMNGDAYVEPKFPVGREIFNHWWCLAHIIKRHMLGGPVANKFLEYARNYIYAKPTHKEKAAALMNQKQSYFLETCFYISLVQYMEVMATHRESQPEQPRVRPAPVPAPVPAPTRPKVTRTKTRTNRAR